MSENEHNVIVFLSEIINYYQPMIAPKKSDIDYQKPKKLVAPFDRGESLGLLVFKKE